MGIEGLAGAGAKGLDFEGRNWVRLFQGEYAIAKLIMARLDVVPTHVVKSREIGGSPPSAVWGRR
jgi:hypothetical protein